METIDLIMIGYGVAILFLAWDRLELSRRLDEHARSINFMIDKHNSLVQDLADFAEEVSDSLDSLESTIEPKG